jgi:hypothetical protein
LTKKIITKRPGNDDSDEEMETKSNNVTEQHMASLKLEKSSKNPWISFYPVVDKANQVDTENKNEMNEIYKRPKAYVDQQELEKAQKEIDDESSDDIAFDETPDRPIMPISNNSEIIANNHLNDIEQVVVVTKTAKIKKKNTTKKVEFHLDQQQQPDEPDKSNKNTQAAEIDPKKILLLSETDQTDDICDSITNDRQGSLMVSADKSEIHRLTISEAFADDDVIEEFKTEKVKTTDLVFTFNCEPTKL